MSEGWIKLYRKFDEWEWFNISEMVHLFIYLLLNANHEDGEWRGVALKRGQIITGLHKLNERTKISIQTIRTCLERLKRTGEINIQTTNQYSIITIINYESYQDNQQTTNKRTNKRLTNDQQTTNNKQEGKEREEGKEIKNVVLDLYKSVVIYFDEELRPKTEAQKKNWLDSLDKLIRIDGHAPDEIREVIKRARMDDFWRTNFLSVTKLRNTNKEGVKYFTVFKSRFSKSEKSFGIPDQKRDYSNPQTEF